MAAVLKLLEASPWWWLGGGVLLGTVLGGLLVTWLVAWRATRTEPKVQQVLRAAREEADRLRREAVLAGKEAWLKRQARLEKKQNTRWRDLQRQETDLEAQRRGLGQAEKELQGRERELGEAREQLRTARAEVRDQRAQLDALVDEEHQRLEKLSGLTREEARRQLLEALRSRAKREAAQLVREVKTDAQTSAEWEAQKIIALAIERQAADWVTQRSTSQVVIDNPRLKGRVIGHDGCNIRAFEKLTGIQLLVDDSPGTIVLSGFNPIRREVARMTLQHLVSSEAINPRRIQTVVARSERKMLQRIREAGQQAIAQVGVEGVPPDVVELVGRLRFRTSYGQNVLEHSIEVAHLCGVMAAELGLDVPLAKRAGLFHDIGKAIDYEMEGTHPEIGVELARKYKEPEVVINAIASHHEDVEVTSPISVLVAAADTLSGARPGARRRTTMDYIKRVADLERIARGFPGVDQAYAIQAGREVRVITRHTELTEAEASLLASDISEKIKEEMEYPGRIKVTVIRQLVAQASAR